MDESLPSSTIPTAAVRVRIHLPPALSSINPSKRMRGYVTFVDRRTKKVFGQNSNYEMLAGYDRIDNDVRLELGSGYADRVLGGVRQYHGGAAVFSMDSVDFSEPLVWGVDPAPGEGEEAGAYMYREVGWAAVRRTLRHCEASGLYGFHLYSALHTNGGSAAFGRLGTSARVPVRGSAAPMPELEGLWSESNPSSPLELPNSPVATCSVAFIYQDSWRGYGAKPDAFVELWLRLDPWMGGFHPQQELSEQAIWANVAPLWNFYELPYECDLSQLKVEFHAGYWAGQRQFRTLPARMVAADPDGGGLDIASALSTRYEVDPSNISSLGLPRKTPGDWERRNLTTEYHFSAPTG